MGKTPKKSRGAGKAEKKEKAAKNDSKEKKKEEDAEEEEENRSFLRQLIYDFPLISASLTVVIPYGLYLLYYYIQLQNPDMLSPLLKLRPAINSTTERQVLIVGTMGAGTTQVAHELSQLLQLEVDHEVSDASWHFCRDGTVSWFHGIRFLEHMIQPLNMCTEPLVKGMGYHPKFFSSNTTCNVYKDKDWSPCWQRECIKRVISEWNCARKDRCETPFRKTLFQMRNPMKTIESLFIKFCEGSTMENGNIHDSFLNLTNSLFPHVAPELSGASCIEAVATYVVEYDRMILKAHAEGLIDAKYPLEKSSPCEVAELAGFLQADTTVYKPNHDKVAEYCRDTNDNRQDYFSRKKNQRNAGIVSLGWSDLRGGVHSSKRASGDKTLEKKVKQLFKDLGYRIDDIPEEGGGIVAAAQ